MSVENTGSGLYGSLLGLVLLSQLGLWAVLFQVVKQQGRMLLRLDDLGHRHQTQLPVLNPAAAAGPKIGDPVTSFRLPSLAGQEVSLDDLRGKDVLLVNWSATCGFCDLIAPDLAEHQAALVERGVQLVLISRGDPVANLQLLQQHRLDCPILIQPDGASLDVFRNQGTPVACLLDAEGRVARPLVIGANDVPLLVRELATASSNKHRLPGERPLSESHIVRDGLKPGTEAPTFTLPDLDGEPVTLQEFRGRRVALVFTDPHCGPCDALAPELVGLTAACRAVDLGLIMVGRGDPTEARQKAEQYGFDFPVVLQQRWEISRAYGIFATPVAFLIDENGVIEREVAQGADAVVALIQDQLDARKELTYGHAVR
jgi:peroxiredoxin